MINLKRRAIPVGRSSGGVGKDGGTQRGFAAGATPDQGELSRGGRVVFGIAVGVAVVTILVMCVCFFCLPFILGNIH